MENIFCCECGETHIFKLKDNEKEFMIGLQDILKCLRFAEEEGAVPPLSSDWWIDLQNQYLSTRQWLK